ncbi:MAG TPA: OB-fold domain-containing protein [Candidatus Acidoferrales bacterium]|nr:OB-fold domain-containing protein [Candidatus Acidoferrales bacterium]
MRIPLKDGLFTTPDDPQAARLLGGRCAACGRFNFPAQMICPYCSGDGCETIPLSPRGVIEVCTTVINRPPGYEGSVPFGFGVVELPEGIRIITRITDPGQARPGQTVRLIIEPLCTNADGHEVMTYAFAAIDV